MLETSHIDSRQQALAHQISQRALQRVLAADFHIAVGAKEKNAIGSCLTRQVLEQLQAGGIGPVKVVQQQCYRPRLRKRLQKAGDRPEETLLIFDAFRGHGVHWNLIGKKLPEMRPTAAGIGTNRCRRRFEEQRQRLEEWIEGSSLLRLIATPGC